MATPAFAGEDVDFLALLSEANRRRVLEQSRRMVYPAASIPFQAGHPGVAYILERGLVRVYWTVPDGRQATVAFIYSGNLAGARNLVPGTEVMTGPSVVFVQVVVDSTLLILDLDTVRGVAASEIEVVSAIATQLAARVRYDLRMIAVRSLGNIPERLAFDLMERACRAQIDTGRLEARATQVDLADSIGSSREVVGRALNRLRASGIVETVPGVIRVVDPVGLAQIVRTFVL